MSYFAGSYYLHPEPRIYNPSLGDPFFDISGTFGEQQSQMMKVAFRLHFWLPVSCVAVGIIVVSVAVMVRLMLQPAPIGPPPTKVLSLMQVVTEEELINDEDYEDIMEDMKIECGKFGKIQATALQTLTGVIRDSNAESNTFITFFIGELLNDIF
ncbi:splicing factor U2af large subunit B-like protein isoform X1 [Tanacetum coccineum]